MPSKKYVLIFVLLLVLSSFMVVSASRLPTVGGDTDACGTVLNDDLKLPIKWHLRVLAVIYTVLIVLYFLAKMAL